MEDFSGLYALRDGTEEDHALVYATFLRGMYYGDSWFSLIPKDIFMDNYKVFMSELINSPNTIIKVACLREEPDVILGYSVLSRDLNTAHYVYVKAAWRNHGIARNLLPTTLVYVSHLTKLGKSLLHKFPNTTFNPFSLT